MKFDFQKWITCRKDFQNFEQKNFHFPYGGSNSKFDHPYILEKQIFLKLLLFIFDVFPPYLTVKSIWKSNFFLHMGDLIQKNDFFLIMFFQLHQHVVTFSYKKHVKMKSPIVKTISKKSSKNEKIMKFLSQFYYMWHKFDNKKTHFHEKVTYG